LIKLLVSVFIGGNVKIGGDVISCFGRLELIKNIIITTATIPIII